MIKITNYIKDGDNFIPIEEFQGKVPDPEYVDGAMELTINGNMIITCAEWDYMDDLWGYIATGFDDLLDQSEWTTGFPDQPIELSFRLDKKHNRIEIEIYIPKSDLLNLPQETRKVITNLDEFLTTMGEIGQKFFIRMAEIVPEQQDSYKREAEHIYESAKKLKASYK